VIHPARFVAAGGITATNPLLFLFAAGGIIVGWMVRQVPESFPCQAALKNQKGTGIRW
jgi:hypothetical protein